MDSTNLAELQGVNLLIVGCPTQGWRPATAIRSFLKEVSSERIGGLVVARFDTRFRMPRWMTRSAARVMGGKLREKGFPVLVPPESFFVKGKRGSLRGGELDQASTWARMLVKEVEAPHSAAQR